MGKELPKAGIEILRSDKNLIDHIVQMTGIRSYFLVGRMARDWANVNGFGYAIDMNQGGSDATSV